MMNKTQVDHSLQGIVLCVLGYAFLALQDASVKWLVADYSVVTILFWRALVVVFACLLVVRGLLSIAAWLLYFDPFIQPRLMSSPSAE